jgi:hypothetical protein
MFFGAALWCGADQGLMYRDVRTIGMGDTKIAGGRGGIDFVSNPALLSTVNHVSFSVPMLPLYVNRDLWDMGKFINDNRDKFEDFDTLSPEEKNQFIKDIEPYDGKWARMNISPMVNIAASIGGTGIGLAVYSTDDVGFKIDRGIYEPRVWGAGVSNTVAVVGISRPLIFLYPGLQVGANFKYIDHRTAPLFQIKASDLGSVKDTIDPIIENAKENRDNHFAADIGALLDIPVIDSEVGATVRNLGYAEYASVDVGIAKRFYEDRVTVMADYFDFLDNNKENMFRKIHFGGELDLGMLELRAGVNAGYPALGAGLDFRFLRIDAAWFTDELSNAPGKNEDERFAVQMRLGW